jgi:hypothetical protein
LLIVNQANKEWSCLDDKMMVYCQKLHKLENNFDSLEYLHILQGKNDVVDELELHESSITKALAKANKTTESTQEIMSSVESIYESPEVM